MPFDVVSADSFLTPANISDSISKIEQLLAWNKLTQECPWSSQFELQKLDRAILKQILILQVFTERPDFYLSLDQKNSIYASAFILAGIGSGLGKWLLASAKLNLADPTLIREHLSQFISEMEEMCLDLEIRHNKDPFSEQSDKFNILLVKFEDWMNLNLNAIVSFKIAAGLFISNEQIQGVYGVFLTLLSMNLDPMALNLQKVFGVFSARVRESQHDTDRLPHFEESFLIVPKSGFPSLNEAPPPYLPMIQTPA